MSTTFLKYFGLGVSIGSFINAAVAVSSFYYYPEDKDFQIRLCLIALACYAFNSIVYKLLVMKMQDEQAQQLTQSFDLEKLKSVVEHHMSAHTNCCNQPPSPERID